MNRGEGQGRMRDRRIWEKRNGRWGTDKGREEGRRQKKKTGK